MKTKVSLKKCASYSPDEVQQAVRASIDLLGGIRQFIRPGERILLKPNLLSAKPPERAITTHPEVVRAVLRLVREAGATPIIGDSPGGAIKGVERVWRETGMQQLAAEEGVELVNFETSGAVEKKINHPLLPSIFLSKVVFDVDGVINLPKLKTHAFTVFTGALKNFYGCIPGLRKAEYHKSILPYTDDFSHLLSEIYLLVKEKVRFHVIDGVIGMEGNGPSSGDKRKLDMIVAGTDPVALDTSITHLLGMRPGKIKMISYPARHNIGEGRLSNIEIAGDSPSQFNLASFKFPVTWYYNLIPQWLVGVLGKYMWLKPEIIEDLCTGCRFCANSCPVKAITMNDRNKAVVDKKACISCLCCHELCPVHAVDLKSSLLARKFVRR